MSTEFWIGLGLIPGLLAAALLFWLTYTLVHRAWRALHVSMVRTVKMRPNPISWDELSTGDKSGRPPYIVEANKFRDALAHSPKFFVIHLFGWLVALVREYPDPLPEREDGA